MYIPLLFPVQTIEILVCKKFNDAIRDCLGSTFLLIGSVCFVQTLECPVLSSLFPNYVFVINDCY